MTGYLKPKILLFHLPIYFQSGLISTVEGKLVEITCISKGGKPAAEVTTTS